MQRQADYNENVLVDMCRARDRDVAAFALPGEGLALSVVGYDPYELSYFKGMSKSHYSLLKQMNEQDFQRYTAKNNYSIDVRESILQDDLKGLLQPKRYPSMQKNKTNNPVMAERRGGGISHMR